MTLLTRVWTEGDPLHEAGRRWLGQGVAGLGWVVSRGLWMVAGCGLAIILGVPYLTRSIEESCQRVSGADVEAVLLAHGAQRTETLVQYVDRMQPLVATGIVTPAEVPQAEGWIVCATLLRQGS